MVGLRRIYFFSALLLFFGLSSFAQKAKYQGDIIFRLSQYITWPEKTDDYKFVIGVVGSASDFESFQKLAIDKHELKDNPIEVRYFDCADAIDECHLLYISEECEIEIEKIVKKTKSEPILIVSDQQGYGALGSIINFIESEGKLKIELNEAQALKRGLQVSDQLKNLAVII